MPQASKNAKVQREGNRVRFTVVVSSEIHEILATADDILNYRQLAQNAICAFAEEFSRNAATATADKISA